MPCAHNELDRRRADDTERRQPTASRLLGNHWGVATWGEPCGECGFSWGLSPEEAVTIMADVPARFRGVVGSANGTSVGAGLTWSVTAYVCHVADNLRISAERLVGVARGGSPQIAAYDQDVLAVVRGYDAVAIQGALWSLERAVADWLASVDIARASNVVFDHPERGRYSWIDVSSSNLHDALHHEFDIRRTLTA